MMRTLIAAAAAASLASCATPDAAPGEPTASSRYTFWRPTPTIP
jgi:hypothetical protein